MLRLLALLFLACLAAPAAGHAATPSALPAEQARALTDLATDDADKREAAVGVLGKTGDPKWIAFLEALREGRVYARKQAGKVQVVVAGAKSTRGDREVVEILSAYDRAALGTVPLADLTEVSADRRLRIVIKPFLDADETREHLRNPDAAVRLG